MAANAAMPAPPSQPGPTGDAGAVARMVLVALMWSIAGVVSRHLERAGGFEVTFWRSAFTMLTLGLVLPLTLGPARLARAFRHGGVALWGSGACWAVMFTAFMLAMTMTRVANVLVVSAISPLVTAVFARIFLHERLPPRTWAAIALAVLGIGWMAGAPLLTGRGAALSQADAAGMGVALAVPIAAAANWTLLRRRHARDAGRRDAAARAGGGDAGEEATSMLPAVLLGATLSSAVTLPLAWPFHATPHDLGLLALLGVVQLALPCVMVVGLLRVLAPSRVSLIGQLENVFGVLWAWWLAGEAPGPTVLQGGAVVLAALAGNEWLAGRTVRRGAPTTAPTAPPA